MKERRKPFLVILGTVKTAFPDGQDCKNMSKTDMSSTGGYMTKVFGQTDIFDPLAIVLQANWEL